MSVQKFDWGDKYYTAAFKFVHTTDPTVSFIRYYGVWKTTRNPNQYIKTTLNWQHRFQKARAEGVTKYIRSPNDACYPVQHASYKITHAWISVIDAGTETVDNSMITV